ncbi:aspartate aminotransferase family protein [bacterium]|nr:aspartate aminotransferase family protein [bacterium]
MSDEFKSALEQLSHWIGEYRDTVEEYPVYSQVRPGEILAQLPESLGDNADSFDKIFEDFKNIILPGITHWQHPKFFGYFPSNSSPPSVLAEMLISTLGVQGMSWATSPAATELELRMMDWLRELFGFPEGFSGVIQDSASNATLAAMIVAREKATDFKVNESGYHGQPQLVAYCSEEAHSSIEKAAKAIGLGHHNLRKIPVDDKQQMQIPLLRSAIEEDVQGGRKPFFVVGAFGTTGSTAVDNLQEIHLVSKEHGLWFHVDAAYAGSALVLPEMRSLASGIECADSIVVNPHKWLLTTFDCSAFFIRHKEALIRSFSLLPEYLKTPDCESAINFRDWGLGLGRRFRSLKLWFVLRWYGKKGIQSIIREHIDLGAKLEERIQESENFSLSAHRHFNLVCFRLNASDEANLSLMNRINQSGELFLSHTKLKDQIVLRMVVGQTDVSERHVTEAWNKIEEISREVLV